MRAAIVASSPLASATSATKSSMSRQPVTVTATRLVPPLGATNSPMSAATRRSGCPVIGSGRATVSADVV
jgi:hypothetical protein